MKHKVNEPKKTKHWVRRIVKKIELPLAIGAWGVGAFAMGLGIGTLLDKKFISNKTTNYSLEKVVEFKTEETLKKIPQSTYHYYLGDNWSYGIDIERDGKEDIIISDLAKRIKEIMPVEGGYRITLNTDAERKYWNKNLEYKLKK